MLRKSVRYLKNYSFLIFFLFNIFNRALFTFEELNFLKIIIRKGKVRKVE